MLEIRTLAAQSYSSTVPGPYLIKLFWRSVMQLQNFKTNE